MRVVADALRVVAQHCSAARAFGTCSQDIHSTSTTAAPQPSATAPAHRTPSANLSGASSPCSTVLNIVIILVFF